MKRIQTIRETKLSKCRKKEIAILIFQGNQHLHYWHEALYFSYMYILEHSIGTNN